MKKFFKDIFLFVIPIFFLIFFIFSYNIIKTDFKYAHQSSMIYNEPFDWQKYFIFGELNKFEWDLCNTKHVNHHFKQFGLL